MNADNEPIEDEDRYIESLSDPNVQHELRWQKYIRQAGTSIVKNAPSVTDGKH